MHPALAVQVSQPSGGLLEQLWDVICNALWPILQEQLLHVLGWKQLHDQKHGAAGGMEIVDANDLGVVQSQTNGMLMPQQPDLGTVVGISIDENFQCSALSGAVVDSFPNLAAPAVADFRQQPILTDSIVCRPRHR